MTELSSDEVIESKAEIPAFCIELLPMVKFDVKILPKHIQKLYEGCNRLKNTELLIDGVKFVSGLTYPKLMKWEKAIIIYQVLGKKTGECHFGLLVKYGSRLLSYDGM